MSPARARAGGDADDVLLAGVTLAGGERADVRVAGGRIASVTAAAGPGAPGTAAARHDLDGYVLLPAAAEPHAHLDKTLLAERFPNPAGDFPGAFEAVERAYRSAMTRADVERRVLAAVGTSVQRGYTAFRTHVNCEEGIGARGVEVLCELRAALADLVDLQVAALASKPVTGHEGRDQRAALRDAVDAGADLMGGFPQADARPVEAMRLLVAMAAEAGLGVDLHLDETTDAAMFVLGEYAGEVTRAGLAGRATASHCVSLGMQDPATVARTAEELAEAGVGVVTMPQTNLWLQGRDADSRVPRGLTAVRALRRAGVAVAAGGDNRQDPFNPLGRFDPFETAALAVAAAHLAPPDAYRAVSTDARAVMGLEAVGVEPGARADLVAVRARDLAEAVATADLDRWVFRAGDLVARTRVHDDVDARVLVHERRAGARAAPHDDARRGGAG